MSIETIEVKFTAIGVYLEQTVVEHLKSWKGKTTVELLEEDSGFHKDLIQGTHWIWTHFSFPWQKQGFNVAFLTSPFCHYWEGLNTHFFWTFDLLGHIESLSHSNKIVMWVSGFCTVCSSSGETGEGSNNQGSEGHTLWRLSSILPTGQACVWW